MTLSKLIKDFSDEAKTQVPEGVLDPDSWIDAYNLNFAKLVAKECSRICGSQADQTNILKHFSIPVESKIQYEATKPTWSIEPQYKRKLNMP